jgi:hypothetical protein
LFQADFYPLGFPLSLLTNCLQVLNAARAEWGDWQRLFDAPAAELRVDVSDAVPQQLPDKVTFTATREAFRWFADDEHQATADPAAGWARARLSKTAAEDAEWVRFHFLEGIAQHMATSRYLTPFHASCAAHQGRGSLFVGDSQAGKTSLAYACARHGWTYVSDDGSYLVRSEAARRLVVGSPYTIRMRPDAPELFPELRGHPVEIRGNGKPILRVRPPFSASATAEIDRLVFLRRTPSAEARLTPCDHEIARAECAKWFYTWDPEVHAEQLAALDTMLAGCRIETLEYSNLDRAVDILT